MLLVLALVCLSMERVDGNLAAKELMEHLLTGYNKLVRPVRNNSDVLTVRLKLKLSQLLDVVCHRLLCLQLKLLRPSKSTTVQFKLKNILHLY